MLNIGTENATNGGQVRTYLLAVVGMADDGKPRMANIDLTCAELTREAIGFAIERHCAAATDKGTPIQAANMIVLAAIPIGGET